MAEFNRELYEVGSKIRERRKELGLTATELAIQVDTSAATISSIENGQSATKVSLLIEIAKVLKVSLDYFQPQELEQYSAVPKELTDLIPLLKSKSPLEQQIIMKALAGMLGAN